MDHFFHIDFGSSFYGAWCFLLARKTLTFWTFLNTSAPLRVFRAKPCSFVLSNKDAMLRYLWFLRKNRRWRMYIVFQEFFKKRLIVSSPQLKNANPPFIFLSQKVTIARIVSFSHKHLWGQFEILSLVLIPDSNSLNLQCYKIFHRRLQEYIYIISRLLWPLD